MVLQEVLFYNGIHAKWCFSNSDQSRWNLSWLFWKDRKYSLLWTAQCDLSPCEDNHCVCGVYPDYIIHYNKTTTMVVSIWLLCNVQWVPENYISRCCLQKIKRENQLIIHCPGMFLSSARNSVAHTTGQANCVVSVYQINILWPTPMMPAISPATGHVDIGVK